MFDNLDLPSIHDENARELVERLLNLIEKQAADLRDAQAEIQRLRDEVNRLKGEQGKPKIKGNTPRPAQWVDANGDGMADYCRRAGSVNGSSRTTLLTCTLNAGAGFGGTYYSGVVDWGYTDDAQWVDANGDGKADYCRRAGSVNGSSAT